jgi:hypothetical protein
MTSNYSLQTPEERTAKQRKSIVKRAERMSRHQLEITLRDHSASLRARKISGPDWYTELLAGLLARG